MMEIPTKIIINITKTHKITKSDQNKTPHQFLNCLLIFSIIIIIQIAKILTGHNNTCKRVLLEYYKNIALKTLWIKLKQKVTEISLIFFLIAKSKLIQFWTYKNCSVW